MASKSETGHARNVANFRILIEHCATFGPQYNPGNTAIALAALQTKLTQAEAALQGHIAVRVDYDNATNNRELRFNELAGLTTRVVNALTAAGASPLTVKDAKSVVRKLRGQRAPKGVQPAAEQPAQPPLAEGLPVSRTVSASQRSFDQMTANFARLVQIVQSEPLYTPNEADLNNAGLHAYLAALSTATAEVAVRAAAFTASQGTRDAVLYDPHTGLAALSQAVKAYVKSLYGQTSTQYHAVKGIDIRTTP